MGHNRLGIEAVGVAGAVGSAFMRLGIENQGGSIRRTASLIIE